MRIMKKSRCAFLLAAAWLAALPAAAAPPELRHYRGTTAVADVVLTEPDGCTVTDVYIEANEGRNRNDPASPATGGYVYLVLYKRNPCVGYEFLINATGGGPISPEAFQSHGNLTGVTLQTVVQVTDSISGNTYDVPVSLTWTGEGDITSSMQYERISFGPFTFLSRRKGENRVAQISGPLIFNGTDLVQGAETYAEIWNVRSGSVSIGTF